MFELDTGKRASQHRHLRSAEEESELVPQAREGTRLREAQQQAQRVEHGRAVEACERRWRSAAF